MTFIKRTVVLSWMAALAGSTAALIALGLVSIGFFASLGGLVIAAALALMIGTAVGGMADPQRAGRNATNRRVVSVYGSNSLTNARTKSMPAIQPILE